MKKLGLDLFHSNGLEPSALGKALAILREEGMKEVMKLVFVVIGAAILLYLGLKGAVGHGE
jgi:hypothetical protein